MVGLGIMEKLTLVETVHTPLEPESVAVATPLLKGGWEAIGEVGPLGLGLER